MNHRDTDQKAVDCCKAQLNRTAAAPMTLCRAEGRWLAEDFRCPEAEYPKG